MYLQIIVTFKVHEFTLNSYYYTCSEELVLDYGDSNKLGEPVALQLAISNPTAIPTSFEALISHFPAAKPPTPPTQPMPSMTL